MLEEKYHRQRLNAKSRNIEWLFTFETWMGWWNSTGKIDQRGVHSYEYCMCRFDDIGPYSPDNVYCSTNAENIAFSNKLMNSGWKLNSEQRRNTSSMGGRASSILKREQGKKLFLEKYEKIKHLDRFKRGFRSEASKILNISQCQVKRLLNKYMPM